MITGTISFNINLWSDLFFCLIQSVSMCSCIHKGATTRKIPNYDWYLFNSTGFLLLLCSIYLFPFNFAFFQTRLMRNTSHVSAISRAYLSLINELLNLQLQMSWCRTGRQSYHVVKLMNSNHSIKAKLSKQSYLMFAYNISYILNRI